VGDPGFANGAGNGGQTMASAGVYEM